MTKAQVINNLFTAYFIQGPVVCYFLDCGSCWVMKLFLFLPCRMRPVDGNSWKHAVRSDNSNQPVWSEPEREWSAHPVPAQPVPLSVWHCAEHHVCLSEHGEDWRSAGQPAGAGQQHNSFLLIECRFITFSICRSKYCLLGILCKLNL